MLRFLKNPFCLCPAPGLQMSFLDASPFGNQLGQPLLLLLNQAQRLKFEFVLLVELAVLFVDLVLILLLQFGDQTIFKVLMSSRISFFQGSS